MLSGRTIGALPLVDEVLSVQNGLPQGSVRAILQDNRGFIWIATGDGLSRYDGVRFKTYQHDPRNSYSLSFNDITQLVEHNGKLWLLTGNNSLDYFDPATERTRHVSDEPAFGRALGEGELSAVSVDQTGMVWVATRQHGLLQLTAEGELRQRIDPETCGLTGQTVNALLADRKGRIWLGTQTGLVRFDPATRQVSTFKPDGTNPVAGLLDYKGDLLLSLRGQAALLNTESGAVRPLRSATLMAGQFPALTATRSGAFVGLNKVTEQLTLQPLNAPSAEAPIALLLDQSNVLWAGTNGNGLIRINLVEKLFPALTYQQNFQTDWLHRQLGVPLENIPAPVRTKAAFELRYAFDSQKNLWIAGPGLVPYRLNVDTKIATAVPPTGIQPRLVGAGNPFQLALLSADNQGDIWGLLQADNRILVRYTRDKQVFTEFPLPVPAAHPYKFVAMLVDGGRIWLATAGHGLLRADLPTKRVVRWRHNPRNESSLSSNTLLCIAQDPEQYNYLWIGTLGGGLCRLDKLTGMVRSFTHREGLPNNIIHGILPDGKGNLWLSTNRGICRFNTRSFDVRSYTTEDGLPGDEFNTYESLRLPDGRLIFGGEGGYTVFAPDRIQDDTYRPEVALTGLRINNKVIEAGGPDSILTRDIHATTAIELDHDQNFLSFDFAALQYNRTGRNKYRYKLVGLDNDWVYGGNLATATYTNLSPGRYTLIVNASNVAGVWSPHTHQLVIRIKSPYWASPWAYLAYGVVGLALLIGFLQFRISRVRMNHEMEIKEREATHFKVIDEIKTRFFANITHEFRTPLTLIISPLEQLLQDAKDPQQRNRLNLVHRNATQLLRLINQLLDLSKLDSGRMAVTYVQGDLRDFLEQCLDAFRAEATRQDIQLTFYNEAQHHLYWFDSEKLNKIINNLLFNALKFTKAGGEISLTLNTTSTEGLTQPAADDNEPRFPVDRVRLTVHDTGSGIPAHKLAHIFDRFYQADQATGRIAEGSGIGLALVKELVEIMQGRISVTSQPGVGTTFVIELPCQPVQAIVPAAEPAEEAADRRLRARPLQRTIHLEKDSADEIPQLLLVEDNDELAEFIMDTLTSQPWQVQRARNGVEGLDFAVSNVPDLIISDVIMPEMDGYTLCRAVKNDARTSHIPVMLLTAKSSDESRRLGLTMGADDYLYKPFQVDDLILRVRNRLNQQQRLRRHHQDQLLHTTAVPTVEDEFLRKIYAELDAHLDDSSFNVESLADAVNMSRMNLHRKLKALTDKSASELIRAFRLNRAAELLLTQLTVAEVAYQVGFESPASFSRIFREHFGMTPTEYTEQNRLRSA